MAGRRYNGNGRRGERRWEGPVLEEAVLPSSPETEEQVLSLLLMDDDGGSFRRAVGLGLMAGCFHTPNYRMLWGAVARLRTEAKGADVFSVCRLLEEDGKLARVGGPVELSRIAGAAATSAHLVSAVEMLLGLAQRRAVMRESSALFEASKSGDAEAISEARARMALLGAAGMRGLPPLLSWGGLMDVERPPTEELVDGVLHRASKFMLGGGSKSFKTWVLLDLGISVATGTPWWGVRCAQAPVLYVNFELMEEFCQLRLKEICKEKGIESAPNFYSWHLRGHGRDLKELVPTMVAMTAGIPLGIIILDPIYKCLGERDENSNGDVASLLNEVEALAVRTKAAVCFGHHFAKGNAAGKESRDRVSGAGAWARDPDALLTLTPHEQEDCFSVEFVLRNCRPKAPFVVRWRHPLMERQAGMDPGELKGATPGRPAQHTAEELMGLLGADSLTFKDWQLKAVDAGMSPSTFKRKLGELEAAGRVQKRGQVWMARAPF